MDLIDRRQLVSWGLALVLAGAITTPAAAESYEVCERDPSALPTALDDVRGTTFTGRYRGDLAHGPYGDGLETNWTVERVYAGGPLPVDLVFVTPTCAWTNLTPGERYLFSTAATDIAQAVGGSEPGRPAVTDSLAWTLGPGDALTLAPFDTYGAADYEAALHAPTTLEEALAVLAPDATQGEAPGPATHRGTEGGNYVFSGPLPSEVRGTTFIARYIGDERLPASPEHRLRDVRSYWHVLRVYAGGPLPEVLTLRNYWELPPSLEPGRRYLVSTSDLVTALPEDTLVWRLRADGEVEPVPYGFEDLMNWSRQALAIETLEEALAAVAPDAGAGEPPMRSGDRTPG
jgi:hypothetical protein